jgi:hypothetical protein
MLEGVGPLELVPAAEAVLSTMLVEVEMKVEESEEVVVPGRAAVVDENFSAVVEGAEAAVVDENVSAVVEGAELPVVGVVGAALLESSGKQPPEPSARVPHFSLDGQ